MTAAQAPLCAQVSVTRSERKSKENPRARLALQSTRFHLQNIGVTTCNPVIIMYSALEASTLLLFYEHDANRMRAVSLTWNKNGENENTMIKSNSINSAVSHCLNMRMHGDS